MNHCTLHGCHQPANEYFQNFCSANHRKQFARRWVKPKITTNNKGEPRVYFYDRNKHWQNYEFSNFFPKGVVFQGKKFKTVEHYFQWKKFDYTTGNATTNKKLASIRKKIFDSFTPRKAAGLGKKYKAYTNKNWHKNTNSSNYTMKEKVMYEAVKYKFTHHKNLKKKLKQTNGVRLVEDANKDAFWGRGPNGQGENKLGKILMKVRWDILHNNT